MEHVLYKLAHVFEHLVTSCSGGLWTLWEVGPSWRNGISEWVARGPWDSQPAPTSDSFVLSGSLICVPTVMELGCCHDGCIPPNFELEQTSLPLKEWFCSNAWEQANWKIVLCRCVCMYVCVLGIKPRALHMHIKHLSLNVHLQLREGDNSFCREP